MIEGGVGDELGVYVSGKDEDAGELVWRGWIEIVVVEGMEDDALKELCGDLLEGGLH